MSRCDYDGVFYRVFCVTLLATAFTFTVILTNVFIDIDGLLLKKAKHSHEVGNNENDVTTTNPPYRTTDEVINDKNAIDDSPDSALRTKRSLDISNFHSYMKKHKMKKIFNSRLANLLKQLDEVDGESRDNALRDDKMTVTTMKTLEKLNTILRDPERRNNYNLNKSRENLFTSNVHSIFKGKGIQQMLTKPTRIYPKVQKMQEQSGNLSNSQTAVYDKEKIMRKFQKMSRSNSSKLNSTTLTSTSNSILRKEADNLIGTRFNKVTFILPKTPEVIRHLPEKTNDASKYRHGFDQMDFNLFKKDADLHKKANEQNKFTYNKNVVDVILKLKEWDQQYKKNQLTQVNVNSKNNNDHYFKASQYSRNNSNQQVELFTDTTQKNRLKRHIKIRYDDIKASTAKQKPCRNGIKRTDDDLYVEIETHFDGKGIKGERKKKLVRNLIDRIQKAIRSDDVHPAQDDSHLKKTPKHLQIKKRTQNPLKHSHEDSLGKYMPHNSIEHRKLNPINIILPIKEISRDLDENLEDPYGMHLNTNKPIISKLDKSFEITNSDIEINNVLNSGVPQRFQVPLNNEDVTNHAKVSQNAYADTGNVTLFIKDVDGSGFSVGFNQYMDEPPDIESMKIFSGLENVIKNYHDNYDQTANIDEIDNSIERQHELTKRDVLYDQNEHVLLRRSVQELQNQDYHSDAYKILFDKNILPYENYQDTLQLPNKKAVSSNYEYQLRNYNYNPKNIKIVTKDIKIKALPLVLDNDIFEKKIKTSEIFGLVNLLLKHTNKRKKRSLNVQRITNLKSRIKLNRYLNTKAMQSKKVFLKNKRNKREISKIRIIASDHLHRTPKNSAENIFLMSGENMFSNRAVLREIELPESETGDEIEDEHGEDTVPYNVEESNPETSYQPNKLSDKYNHNVLMSKYPHIITDSITGSKDYGNENEYYISESKPSLRLENLLGIRGTSENIDSNERNVPEIVDAILPSPAKSSYKVTVKILPKNLTNAPSGFKEMHTIINKTYNNNGIQYYSLVNVSEISKVEEINKTKEVVNQLGEKIETSHNLQEQEDKMKLLIGLQKKKIEEQLQHLNKEKDNLEAILRERNGNKERNFNDLLKEVMLEQPQKDITKLSTNIPVMNNLQIQHLLPTNYATTPTAIVNVIHLEPTTTPKVEPKTDAVKTKIEMTIQENQNFTNEILTRINKNTDILQSFLKKLVEKLEPIPQHQTTIPPPYVGHVTEETKHSKSHPDLSKDYGVNLHHMHDTFFGDHIPHKNDSHYAIPFVYAYQHPYISAHQPPLPMAKVVYHGHIHTNAIHNHANEVRKYNTNNYKLPTHATAKNDNTTRFFIDAMEKHVVAMSPKVTDNVDCKHNYTATINIH